MRRLMRAASAIALAAAVLGPVAARADTASDYNLFVLGNLNVKSSDTEGRVAVGGNATFDSYSIGADAPSNTVNLVVGGDLTAGVNGGGATNGLTIVGGTATFSHWSSVGLQPPGTPLPVDFAAEQTQLDALTTTLAGYAATGTISTPWNGGIELTGTSSGLNVFDLSGALLSHANTFILNLAPGGTALINVDGTADSFSSAGTFINGGANGATTYASDILWNFSDATTLSFANIGIVGSVLAPNADYLGGWGVLTGELIVKSFSDTLGATQINTGGAFEGNLLTPPPGVPEPASWALMITGFGLAGATLRRRRGALRPI